MRKLIWALISVVSLSILVFPVTSAHAVHGGESALGDPRVVAIIHWLENGIERGWITEPFCNTHDGDPYMSDEEQEEWESGGDLCQVVFKIKEV